MALVVDTITLLTMAINICTSVKMGYDHAILRTLNTLYRDLYICDNSIQWFTFSSQTSRAPGDKKCELDTWG